MESNSFCSSVSIAGAVTIVQKLMVGPTASSEGAARRRMRNYVQSCCSAEGALKELVPKLIAVVLLQLHRLREGAGSEVHCSATVSMAGGGAESGCETRSVLLSEYRRTSAMAQTLIATLPQ